MTKIYVFYLSFILVIFLSTIAMGQEKILSVETPTISAGAEYSFYLQKLINSGQGKNLEFNGNVPIFNKPVEIDAITTFEGINFDQNATTTGYYNIPPDPIGAAGPNHLVSVVNTAIEWFTKAGVKQYTNRLGKNASTAVGSFFASLNPLTGTFDPKVIYDQYNNRFVVVALERTAVSLGDPSNTSRILVAVSQTSDPNAGWYFYSINSAITIGTLSFADYPGLAVSSTGIYITANMFSFSTSANTGGRLWIINKTPFYTGGAATSIVRDHITSGSGYNTTYQPAQMFGTAQSGVGTFLVAYSGLSGGGIEAVHVIRVGSSLTSPTFNGTAVSMGDIDNTGGSYLDAPQLGTSILINTNDRRTQNAVWRSNSLWSAFTVVPNSGTSAGQVTAHWLKINTTTLTSLTVSDQGDIGGEDIATGTYTFFPSIAVNSVGDAIIGFSASAPTIYPGAYYAGRYSTTTPGTVLASQVFKQGSDYYYRAFGGTRNRWGDYSGSSVDLSDDLTFYIFNEYALTRGTVLASYPSEDGRWGIAFGVVPVSVLPVELTSFSASVVSNSVKLNWETATEINNYGFEILRQAEDDKDWSKIGFINGNGNSNSPKSYSFEDKNALSGKYFYRLKQIDNDGKFEYSKTIEVDLGTPKRFELSQNYPNPFNPSTTIRYSLPEAGSVKLTLYDILGQEVRIIFNEFKEAGIHTFNFNAGELNSGIYIYKIEAGSFTQTKKMILIK